MWAKTKTQNLRRRKEEEVGGEREGQKKAVRHIRPLLSS